MSDYTVARKYPALTMKIGLNTLNSGSNNIYRLTGFDRTEIKRGDIVDFYDNLDHIRGEVIAIGRVYITVREITCIMKRK